MSMVMVVEFVPHGWLQTGKSLIAEIPAFVLTESTLTTKRVFS